MSTATLGTVAFGDCGTWWVGGDGGTLLQSGDGGGHWAALGSGTTQRIRRFVFVDGYGYYADDGGQLHRCFHVRFPTNLAPIVTLVLPVEALTNWACHSLDLDADAFDFDGQVVRVDYIANGIPVALAQPPRWRSSWTRCETGVVSVTVVATDARGATGVGALPPVAITHVLPPLHLLGPVESCSTCGPALFRATSASRCAKVLVWQPRSETDTGPTHPARGETNTT